MGEKGGPGAAFEERVAALFRLIGATVEHGIEICGKKVDLLVTIPLPASRAAYRLIVECKAEKTRRAQNQRVMEFKGLLEVARAQGTVDGAEIVTLAPWSEQAKGFGRQADITVLSYEEKIRNLINFDPYLRLLIESVEITDSEGPAALPLSAYYLEPTGKWYTSEGPVERTTSSHVLSELTEWALSSGAPDRVAVLAGYGTGKTSLCRMLAAQLARRYFENPSSAKIPILIRLHEFTHEFRQESVISYFLDEECGVANPRYGLFREMRKAGLFVLLLDGFDEMAAKADTETLALNAHELDKLIGDGSCRALLTSRPELFFSESELRATLVPGPSPVPMGSYKLLVIDAWTEEREKEFFRRRVSGESPDLLTWEEAWGLVEATGLADLALRPVLADMIVRTLPMLKNASKPIGRAELYEKFLRGELQRQRFSRGRGLLLADDLRLDILQKLAAEAYVEPTFTLEPGSVKPALSNAREVEAGELSAYAREFLTCSFLRRVRNRYVFSHGSIQEFLVAREYGRNVDEQVNGAFGRAPLDANIGAFLSELLTNDQRTSATLLMWICNTSRSAIKKFRFLGGAAATVLVMFDKTTLRGEDLSGANLLSADLRRADLRGTKLTEAFLEDVDLRGARVELAEFERVKRYSGRVACFATWPKDVTRGYLGQIIAGAVDEQEGLTLVGVAMVPHGSKLLVAIDIAVEEEGVSIRELTELTRHLRRLKRVGAAWVFEEERGKAIEAGALASKELEERIAVLVDDLCSPGLRQALEVESLGSPG